MDINEARQLFEDVADKQVWSQEEVRAFIEVLWVFEDGRVDRTYTAKSLLTG
jgi:hypothetical protein